MDMDKPNPEAAKGAPRRPGRSRGAKNLTNEDLATFLERVRLGDTAERACELAGRSRSAIYARARRDSAFAARWEDARGCRALREGEFLRGLREGLTISAAARIAPLSEFSIYERMRSDPGFRERVEAAKGPLQGEAERALLRQAIGSPEREAERDADGREVAPHRPAEPGNPAQLRFLLRNRFPAEWNEGRFRR
jgi:hypothetical protein